MNNPDLIPSLSNDSLISILCRNKKNVDLLNELYSRIDAGNNVFDRNYFCIEMFGRNTQDSESVFGVLSSEYKSKVIELIKKSYSNLPQELKNISINGRNVFDQAALARVYNSGQLDERGLKFLLDLVKENPNRIKDLNFDLLNSTYIDDLGEDFLKTVINDQQISSKIINLHNTSPNLYNSYLKLLSNMQSDDSLYTLYPKATSVLDFMFVNKNKLSGLSADLLLDDSFIDYVMYNSMNQYNRQRIDIPFSKNYINDFGKACDEKFYDIINTKKVIINDDGEVNDLFLDNLKEIFYFKYFSTGELNIRNFITKYGTNLDEIRKIDSEVASIVDYFKFVDSITDRNALKELYESSAIRISPEEFLHIDDRLRKAYAITYQDALAKTDSFVSSSISSNKAKVVIYNGKPINVVDLGDKFSLIVRSSDSGLVSDSINLRNNSYIDTWNSPDAGSNHILATSYITESNIGCCPVNNSGVLYGFGKVGQSKIMMMRPSDLNSHINSIGYSSGENQVFVTADNMSKYTTRIYNEVDLEKVGTTPDYVIIYNDSPDQLVKNAYQAASEWNIPVLRIDKNKLATTQSNLINDLMSNFKQTKDINFLKEALDLFESNSSGYKLNSYVADNAVDRTVNINNQSIYDSGLFDSVTIEDDILDYIDELSKIPDNRSQVDELINIFKDINAKYELTNDIGNKLLANTKSNLALNALIEMLEEIRK